MFMIIYLMDKLYLNYIKKSIQNDFSYKYQNKQMQPSKKIITFEVIYKR